MDSRFVFTDKATSAKVRVVVRGDQQWPPSKSADTNAPTPPATEICMLAALAAVNNWGLHSMDISQAFVQADPLDPATPFYVHGPHASSQGSSSCTVCPPGTSTPTSGESDPARCSPLVNKTLSGGVYEACRPGTYEHSAMFPRHYLEAS
jgi:hypothetical protein